MIYSAKRVGRLWHDLSDVKLADALDDRASFRRFCGFAHKEATPERTAFVRFHRELLRRSLDERLFDEITVQLKDKAIRIKTGTMADATVVGSAIQGDDEARWSGHSSRKAVHGYKVHVGADADTALVEKLAVTPGNAHDGRNGEVVLPDEPGDDYADSGYRGEVFGKAVRTCGGRPRVVATHVWAQSEEEARRMERPDPSHPVLN